MSFLVALRKELLEQTRTYRLLVVAVVLVVMGLGSPLLAKLTPQILELVPGGEAYAFLVPPPTIADAVGQYVKNMSQFGVILAILLTMGAVAQEKERGTAALVLSKPLPRGPFLGAKAAAQGLSFAASTALAGAGAYYYTTLLFGAPSAAGWLVMNALMAVFFGVYVAVTLLCSVLSRSQAMAGGLAVGALVILGGLGSLPTIGDYLPNRLLTWGANLALNMEGAFWPALAISVAIIALSLLVGWAILRRQEL